MRIDLGGGKAFEVDIQGARSANQAVARIARAPGVDALVNAIAERAYYARYRPEDLSDNSAKDVAQELFESGYLAALGKISDITEDVDNGMEDEADNAMSDASAFKGIVEALGERFPRGSEDDMAERLKSALRDRVIDALETLDTSKEADAIPDHVRVEVVHYFGMGELSPDDRYMRYEGNVFEPGTAIPDERLAAFFEGLNIDFSAFAAHVAKEQGVDLRGGASDAALVDWLTQSDYLGDRDSARERALSRAAAWQAFAPSHDAERPALLSPERAWTVLTEATGSGVPCFVARVPLKQLLEVEWDTPLRFDSAKGYREQTGGFVGIYDPVNGSGHIERTEASVQVPAGTDGWRVSGRGGYAVDSVFGIVGSCYYATVEAVPAPEPKPEVEVEAPRM
jgi:hypothetical protein